jgi:hypothetical protein
MIVLNTLKFSLKYTVLTLSLLLPYHICASDTKTNINTDIPKIKTYTGTIVPLQTNQYVSGTDFSFDGFVDSVAQVGSLIYPEITDMTGNIFKEGTVIIQLRKNFWSDMVLSSKSEVYAAKADLLTAAQQYKRYNKLTRSKTKVASIEKYQDVRAAYYDALSKLNKAKADLLESEIILKTCTQYAPFVGIVDNVYLSEGRACGNPQTIEISQLDPVGIKVKMPRREAKKIKISSLVKIYKANSNIVYGIYSGHSMLCKDGIMLQTENKLKSFHNKTIHKGKIIPQVSNISFVDSFYNLNPNSKILSISVDSLKKDKKEYYVWKLLNTKALELNNDKSIFKVKKIYVVPDNLKREIGGYSYYIALKNSGSLQINDLVLTTLPNNPLQDGDLVKFIENKYIFMPGDKLKVVIDF